ncbi:hypothetical protein [Methylomonas albis]|uniref:PEP-CTERM protein-sorting domain-containing protein n=1 Tax=Methylomonas albis TaxID=1854563 RepID=A0ABR9D425_9GAMM|nr:hypothetical protein [Methylomonas albis]MBD9357853.1 hypothetical protein [Methylomonas albis]
MIFRKTAIAALLTTGLAGVSGQAFAHQYYNLTGAGTVASGDSAIGFGIANSINGTDGVSANSNGTNRVANGTNTYTVGDLTANTLIPGTGTAAATATEVSGNLPYMWYSGQHTYGGTGNVVKANSSVVGVSAGATKREIFTGSSVTDNTGSLANVTGTGNGNSITLPNGQVIQAPSTGTWGTNVTTGLWNAYNAKNTGANASTWGTIMADLPTSGPNAGDHPYIAVAGNSAETGLGLDYGLIHISCGDNSATDNCATTGNVLTTISIKADTDYAANNLASGGLLDVALYRGADSSLSSSRTAAADITGAAPTDIQGSDLGAAIWSAHATSLSDLLSFSFIFNQAEWNATDTAGLSETNGFYTLVVGAHGGSALSGLTYDVLVTTSAVPVPGAVWLFGSAMAGLIGFGRRKNA